MSIEKHKARIARNVIKVRTFQIIFKQCVIPETFKLIFPKLQGQSFEIFLKEIDDDSRRCNYTKVASCSLSLIVWELKNLLFYNVQRHLQIVDWRARFA